MLSDKFKDKIVLMISHDDLDGTGCRILAEYFLENICSKLDIKQVDIDDIELLNTKVSFNDYDIILFTDLVPTENLIKYLREIKKEFLIFDHHTASYDRINTLVNESEYFYDEHTSATKIFYNYLSKSIRKKHIIHEFVNLVDTYDNFNDKSFLWNEAQNLNRAFWSYVNWVHYKDYTWYENHRDFSYMQLKKFRTLKSFIFYPNEIEYINDAVNKEKREYKIAIKRLAVRSDSKGLKYGYTECSSKISIVAYMILKERQDLHYIIIHSTFSYDKGYNFSLRSRKDEEIDVSEIAVIWDGGGHLNAAGFTLPLSSEKIFESLQKGKIHFN